MLSKQKRFLENCPEQTIGRYIGRMSNETTQAAAVELHPGWIRVPLPSGYADFHLKWLRHQCDQDRHPLTRERLVDSSQLADEWVVTEARIEDDALVVRWASDGRQSRYPLHFLEEYAYAKNRVAAPPPPSDLLAITLFRQDDLATTVAESLARLAQHGAVVVRRTESQTVPPEDETEALIDAFLAHGLRVIGTHFGRIEDLRTDNTTNANTDQLGYTDAAIGPHTDQPFLDAPPRLQLLQAIRAADSGGENHITDARAAASYLRDLDSHSYEVLTTTPVDFHRRQAAFERRVVSPILSKAGDPFLVRYSYFTMAPLRLPFAKMEDFYRAYDRFARIVRDPKHQYRFTLRAGDFVLYDNHRMLHARTAFVGRRWVRGIYFDT